MQDQRVVLRTAFRRKDMRHRLRIQPVGPKAVNGLRRDTYQTAPADDLCRQGQIRLR